MNDRLLLRGAFFVLGLAIANLLYIKNDLLNQIILAISGFVMAYGIYQMYLNKKEIERLDSEYNQALFKMGDEIQEKWEKR